MGFNPKIIQIVDTLFAGTDLVQMRNELLTLLYNLINEADDDEIDEYLRDICKSTAQALQAAGKENVDEDTCYDLLKVAVEEERAKIRARYLMHRMFKRRKRNSEGIY